MFPTGIKFSLFSMLTDIYGFYHFQDIRGSKWDQHSKFETFINKNKKSNFYSFFSLDFFFSFEIALVVF
jgi:hypothetical protein